MHIYVRGSAFDSSEGNQTHLLVDGESRGMSTRRGLNTVILNPVGSAKLGTSHDVYGNQNLWNDWANWVNTNAAAGDLVAVATYDALRNAPQGGAAERLLNSVNAEKAFNATSGQDWRRVRSPYALLFTVGMTSCIEVSQPYGGPNAHLMTDLVAGVPPTAITRPVLRFDGVNDYVSAQINVGETDHTVSLWFKTDHPNCGLFSVDAGDQGASGHDRHIYLRDGNIYIRLYSNETISTSGTNYADNQWHKVAHVFGGQIGPQRVYVDGKLVVQGNKSQSDFNWQDGINIGFCNDASNPYFKGEIAEVAVWAVARPERNLSDRQEWLSGKETGLLGYWTFTEGQGAVVQDQTGNGHNGAIHGTVAWAKTVDYPGPAIGVVGAAAQEALRNEGEALSKVGASLGQNYLTDPPADLPSQPLTELIRQKQVPQYDLMQSLQSMVQNNQLSLNKNALGAYGEIGDLVGSILDVFVTVRNPEIEFVKGQPGMVGAPGMEVIEKPDQSGNLATPEDHALKLSGDVTLFGQTDVRLEYADFFHYKGKPNCSFKFLFQQPMGIGSVLPGVPLIEGLQLSGPVMIAATASTLYDPTLDSGINEGFNFFGNVKVAESNDAAIRFIGDLLQVQELAVHTAVDTSSTIPQYILEAAVQRDVTVINGSNFKLRFTRSDVGISVKGAPPEPALTISNDMVVTLIADGKENHLVFTGGIKVEAESITGSFTMNGTGRSPQGALSGTVQNTGEWREPFGIPGVVIRQMAAQVGCTYLFPWVDNIGVHANLKIGDVDGSISVLADTNDPDQFVLAGATDRITMFQMLSAMSPVTFVAYQALPSGTRNTLNKVVDVALEDVKVSIVPVACSIGGVHFRDEGVTIQGSLTAWGWNASAYVNVDTFDGITVRADMDPLDIGGVFKLTGAQNDPAPIMRMKVSPSSTPYLYVSGKVYLLGLSQELRIEANESGLSFFLRSQVGNFLTTKLTCTYGDGDFEATGSIDFNLNVNIPTSFGTIPLVNIGFDAATTIRAGQTHGFYLSVSGSFQFYGQQLTMPTLTLQIAPSTFEALYNAVIKQIRDAAEELFKSIFRTLEEWANAVAQGVVQFSGAVADVAKNVYNASAEAAIQAYKTISQGATEIAQGLRSVYGYTSRQAASALRTANYAVKTVGRALENAYRLGAKASADALKVAGYAVNEVGGALKDVYNVTDQGMADALKFAGYTVNEVGNTLNSFFTLSASGMADALEFAGYGINETGGFVKDTYNLTAQGLNDALKAAGYATSEVETFFRGLGGEFESFFDPEDTPLNPSNW